MRYLIVALSLLLASVASPVWAVEPDEILADPAQEARAREISKELRCLVCRNENIDASSAGLAKDLRLLVRERITAGDSDTETIDYIVERYGEFVLLRPQFNAGNLIIWVGGPLMLLIGGVGAWLFMRGRIGAPTTVGGALSEEERQRLEQLTRE
ncbi:MAG: cytochrome c-type biogenesis protein [Pikeienuella sp.]